MQKQYFLLRDKYFYAAMVSSAAILAINIVRPFHHDNAIYQSIALQWLRYGRLPYIGTMDNNFPGIVYVHLLSCLIFGNSETGFRIIETTLQLCVSGLMFVLVRRWYSSRASFLAAILSAEIYLSGGDWGAGQRDSFAVLTLLLALVLLFQLRDSLQARTEYSDIQKKQRGAIWELAKSFFIGIAMGMTVLLRPTYALFCLALVFTILWTFGRDRWKILALFSFGCLTICVLVLLPYVDLPGAFRLIYLATIRLNVVAYGTSAYRRTPWAAGAWKHWLFAIVALGASVGLFFYHKLNREGKLPSPALRKVSAADLALFFMLFLGAAVSIIWMGKYFRTHFHPIYQLSIVLVAIAVERVVAGIAQQRFRRTVLALVIVVGAGFLYSWSLLFAFTHAITHNVPHPIESVAETIYPDSLWGYAKQKQLASYIVQHSIPTDRNELATADPWLSYRTGLQLVSRFTEIVHLLIKRPDGTYAAFQKKWQSDFLDSLRTIRPKFFVTALGPTPKSNEFLPDVPARALQAIPGYDSLLQTYYRYDTTIGWWLIYQRRD